MGSKLFDLVVLLISITDKDIIECKKKFVKCKNCKIIIKLHLEKYFNKCEKIY